jgi:hypothetical protein
MIISKPEFDMVHNRFFVLMALLFIFQLNTYSQKLPVGYIEQYSEKCINNNFFKTFYPENISNWRFIEDSKSKTLIIATDSLDKQVFPDIRGIIRNMVFGDCIIEFEFRTNKKTSVSEGFCFLGPVKSIRSYYVFLFSSDSILFSFINKGEIILVDRQPAAKTVSGWNKVRIERDILNRSITIIMNGDYIHKNNFTDKNLVMGYVGFGTNKVSGFLRNIKIWAPTSISDTTFTWH